MADTFAATITTVSQRHRVFEWLDRRVATIDDHFGQLVHMHSMYTDEMPDAIACSLIFVPSSRDMVPIPLSTNPNRADQRTLDILHRLGAVICRDCHTWCDQKTLQCQCCLNIIASHQKEEYFTTTPDDATQR